MTWQRDAGCGHRSLADGHRVMAAPRSRLRALCLSSQQGEMASAVAVLNRMIQTAKPISVRAA
jgi:hypothetical protein